MTEYVVIHEPKERPGSTQIMGRSHYRVNATDEHEAVRHVIGAFSEDGSFWVVPTSALKRVVVEKRYEFRTEGSS